MAIKVPKKLQAKWEAILAKEGLAPITNYSAGERDHRRLVEQLRASTPEERASAERYQRRAEKMLDRLVMAHAVWALHCQGLGRGAIGARLALPEKVVRLVLDKVKGLASL